MRVLVLCTGNSCRSQMVEGILREKFPDFEVFSAGTEPVGRVHPEAVKVLAEIGVDISGQRPKGVEEFLGEDFDVVVTVCGEAEESCPVFRGEVGERWHVGFDDPVEPEDFRRVRDEIVEGLVPRIEDLFKR